MGNLQHTPGPWEILKQAPPFQIGIGTDKYTIAYTSVNVDRSLNEVQEANAKLIAAAPDLLRALMDIMDGNKTAIENNGGQPHIQQAIKAIEKATK